MMKDGEKNRFSVSKTRIYFSYTDFYYYCQTITESIITKIARVTFFDDIEILSDTYTCNVFL